MWLHHGTLEQGTLVNLGFSLKEPGGYRRVLKNAKIESVVWNQRFIYQSTLPETNSSPLKIGLPNRKVVFQPSIFRGELLVSGRVFLKAFLNRISDCDNLRIKFFSTATLWKGNSSISKGTSSKLNGLSPIGPFPNPKTFNVIPTTTSNQPKALYNQSRFRVRTKSQLILLYFFQMIAHKNPSSRLRQLFMIGTRKWLEVTNTKQEWSHVGPSNWNFDFRSVACCVDTKGLPFGILWDFSGMRQDATYLWVGWEVSMCLNFTKCRCRLVE